MMDKEIKDLVPFNTKLEWKEVPRDPQMWLPFPPLSEKYPQAPQNARPSQAFRHYPGRVAETVPPKKALPEDVNQLLDNAADYFDKGGTWCQDSMSNTSALGSPQVCLVGSLLWMETGDRNESYQPTQSFRHPLTTAAVEKVSKYMASKGITVRSKRGSEDPNFEKVSNWNDTKGRTKEEVVDLLRKVAHG